MVSIPSNYYGLIAGLESGNNPNAKAGTSSASGLYQFTKSTWEGLGFNWADRFDTAKQNTAVQKLTTQNASLLERAGIAVNNASLYAAHFLGGNAAVKALGANPNTPISNVVSSAAIKANPSVFGKVNTVADFGNWLQGKTGTSTATTTAGSNFDKITGLGDGLNYLFNPFDNRMGDDAGSLGGGLFGEGNSLKDLLGKGLGGDLGKAIAGADTTLDKTVDAAASGVGGVFSDLMGLLAKVFSVNTGMRVGTVLIGIILIGLAIAAFVLSNGGPVAIIEKTAKAVL